MLHIHFTLNMEKSYTFADVQVTDEDGRERLLHIFVNYADGGGGVFVMYSICIYPHY